MEAVDTTSFLSSFLCGIIKRVNLHTNTSGRWQTVNVCWFYPSVPAPRGPAFLRGPAVGATLRPPPPDVLGDPSLVPCRPSPVLHHRTLPRGTENVRRDKPCLTLKLTPVRPLVVCLFLTVNETKSTVWQGTAIVQTRYLQVLRS